MKDLEKGIKVTGGENFVAPTINVPTSARKTLLNLENDEAYYASFPPDRFPNIKIL